VSPEVISFEQEAIGYIEDELAQGYGLEQIKQGLLEEGYPEEVIQFAAEYVEKHARLSKKDKEKTVKRTDEHHVARRFHVPVLGIAALILILLVAFFFVGIGEEEPKASPEQINILLYDSLGLTPAQGKISGGAQVYARDEIVERIRAESMLKESKSNPLLSGLKMSDAVTGFQKKATAYSIIKSGIEQLTLVEMRFQANRNVDLLKIIEAVPKTTAASSDEISLPKGGLVAERDPVIIFNFNNVKMGDVLKASYVIKKQLSTLDTLTFPAEESKEAPRPTAAKVCGDGRCVEGENYMSCCTDCGCTPGSVCESNTCVAAKQDQCRADAECNDNDAATRDTCSGTPKTCQHTTITECISADGYCAEGCAYEADNDCEQPVMTAAPEETTQPEITGEQESPDIINITITPEESSIGDEVTIEAKVLDPNGKQDIARVWVEILELAQSHGEIGDMNDKGLEGDAVAGDDKYTVVLTISDYYVTSTYHASIFAQDHAGNKKKSQKTFRVAGNETG
jgi:hypothetical protein